MIHTSKKAIDDTLPQVQQTLRNAETTLAVKEESLLKPSEDPILNGGVSKEIRKRRRLNFKRQVSTSAQGESEESQAH